MSERTSTPESGPIAQCVDDSARTAPSTRHDFLSGSTLVEHGITIMQPRHSAAMHYVALCLCGWRAEPWPSRQRATSEGQAHILRTAVALSSATEGFWPADPATETVIARFGDVLRRRDPLTTDEVYDVASAIGCGAQELLAPAL